MTSHLDGDAFDDDPRIFVANNDGTFDCQDCIPANVDVGSEEVETWLEGTTGWLAPLTCRTCGRPIDVVVEGEEQ